MFNALPAVKKYETIVPIVQSARESLKTDTPAADMNLVYAAAKVMDPDSVVRESETAMVIDTGSPAQKFLGAFNYVAGGGRLTPETRAQLQEEIESRAQGYEEIYNEAASQYQEGTPAIGKMLPKLGAGRKKDGKVTPRNAPPSPSAQGAPAAPPGAEAAGQGKPAQSAFGDRVAQIEAAFAAGPDTPERRAKMQRALQAMGAM